MVAKQFRKKLLVGVFSCFLLWSASGCNPFTDPLGIKLNLKQYTLSNGMAVLLVEDPTTPVVSYQTWFHVGSVDEERGNTGMAHLFEHLLFKGTEKYGPKQFFQQLEAAGAEVNAFTTRDYTVFYEDFSPPLLEKVIEMESDRMANLILNDDVLNSERMVVFEERRLRMENSPEGKMQEALWQLAFRSHPYQWPVIGYPSDLLNITVPKLKEFMKTYFQPGNAAVIVAGNFKSADVMKWIRKNYDGIPGKPKPKRKIPPEYPQTEERRFVIRDAVVSERFAQAYPITSAQEDDSYALDVLAAILFEGTSSRAYRRLVEERDLVLSISGSAYTPAHPGLFIVTGTLKGGVPSALAEDALWQLIQEVQSRGVTQEEIQVAVKQLTVQLIDGIRSSHGMAPLLGTVQMIFGSPTRFLDDLKKYHQVTVADVQRVSQKYFNPNRRSVVTVIPQKLETKSAARLEKGAKK